MNSKIGSHKVGRVCKDVFRLRCDSYRAAKEPVDISSMRTMNYHKRRCRLRLDLSLNQVIVVSEHGL